MNMSESEESGKIMRPKAEPLQKGKNRLGHSQVLTAGDKQCGGCPQCWYLQRNTDTKPYTNNGKAYNMIKHGINA